jgi:NCAIR mutase (PurE)-related protein
MFEDSLRELLTAIKEERVTIEDAILRLRKLPFEDIGFAHLDTHRTIRGSFPEVVLCLGKRTDQILEILTKLSLGEGPILATRASVEVFLAVKEAFPEAVYNESGRTIVLGKTPLPKCPGKILIVSAGTADIPVAEEAVVTADVMGNSVDRLFDVGVSGLHRLLAHLDQIQTASVIVVVAGMEGALPSVIGGLVQCPVIAVPTSIGYGASYGGLAALLGMLNSCSAGVTVVNIDNGFGAGYAASLINHLSKEK